MRVLWILASGVLALKAAGAAPPQEPRAPEPYTLEQRFLEAARQGDRASLEKALARGVSPKAQDDLHRNALLLAARDAGSLEVVRFLRARGVAVDAPDLGGRAAISWAAGDGRLEIVRALAGCGRADRSARRRRPHALLPGGARRSPGGGGVPARQGRGRELRRSLRRHAADAGLRQGLQRDGDAAARARRGPDAGRIRKAGPPATAPLRRRACRLRGRAPVDVDARARRCSQRSAARSTASATSASASGRSRWSAWRRSGRRSRSRARGACAARRCSASVSHLSRTRAGFRWLWRLVDVFLGGDRARRGALAGALGRCSRSASRSTPCCTARCGGEAGRSRSAGIAAAAAARVAVAGASSRCTWPTRWWIGRRCSRSSISGGRCSRARCSRS